MIPPSCCLINRIDVIADPVDSWPSARVLIDGKAPSTFPELYYHARPSPTPVAGRLAFNRIDHQALLLVETWTAQILECDLEADDVAVGTSVSESSPAAKHGEISFGLVESQIR